MSITLAVKVIPGASHPKVAGWLGHELKLRVSAPAERGKANQGVEKLLATLLGLAPKQVNIIKGHTSIHKIVELQNIKQAALTIAFGKPDSAQDARLS